MSESLGRHSRRYKPTDDRQTSKLITYRIMAIVEICGSEKHNQSINDI